MFSRKTDTPTVRSNYHLCTVFLLILVGFLCSTLVEGSTFVSTDCTIRCVCWDDQISCNTNYKCSPYAECREDDGIRGCYCKGGYEGNGATCTPVTLVTPKIYTDCYEAHKDGNCVDGVYNICPSGWPGKPFPVFCDMTTDGGGWTVFQRRIDGVSNFYRGWTDYKNGFGSTSKGSDYWLGNEKLHYLTKQKPNRLRVDITKSDGSTLYAEYKSFSISSEDQKYKLKISKLTAGNAGDGLYRYDCGGYFTTRDKDNDQCSSRNCAEGVGGAGWYTDNWCKKCKAASPACSYYGTTSCRNWCSYFNLNGIYNGKNGQDMYWRKHCNLKYANMKIRPSGLHVASRISQEKSRKCDSYINSMKEE